MARLVADVKKRDIQRMIQPITYNITKILNIIRLWIIFISMKYKLKIRKYIIIAIPLIFLGTLVLSTIVTISILNIDFDILKLYIQFSLIVTPLFAYIGLLNYFKLIFGFLKSLPNKFTGNILTIIIIGLGIHIILFMWNFMNIELNYNDQGIILEIMGFFIYLSPVRDYIQKSLDKEDLKNIDSQFIIKTTAIGFVLIGLVLQFSYFSNQM